MGSANQRYQNLAGILEPTSITLIDGIDVRQIDPADIERM